MRFQVVLSLGFLPLLWVSQTEAVFQNPIFDETWPDPYCYLHTDGFYYMPRKENVSIALYKSPILRNWREATKAIVYTAPNGLLNLWAPEIFFIGGQWYMYFALDNGDNANHRPDPYCYLHTDGFYYMPRSENDGIALYKSPILRNWREATKAIVYTAPNGLLNLWAPEIFFIGGQWYMYFALDNGDNANHRMYVIRANDPANPMGSWTAEKRLSMPGEDVWAIDGTVLEYGNGQLYFIWSGWPTVNAGFPQNLYIAPMSDPETISGSRVLINQPTLSWQMHGAALLEGPQILHHAGRVFVVYSCSGSWTADYQLGFMGIDDLKDPLVPGNWWRHDQPVFWRNDAEGVYGVGHASFTTSKDKTEPWIVYHAMANPDAGWGGRTARISKFGWNLDNSPAFPRPLGFNAILQNPSGE